jgi:signal transduction histidine kinase
MITNSSLRRRLSTLVQRWTNRPLEELRTNLLDVQETERRRIAAELHDDPVQVLTVAVMRLDLLRAAIDDPEAKAKLEDARAAVRDAIDRLRSMLFELHPPALEREGLAVALDEYCTELFAGTDVTVTIDAGLAREAAPAVRGVLFRIAREAISNARKHASPTKVDVAVTEQHGGIAVTVTDDGVGFASVNEGGVMHRGVDFAAELSRSAGGWWKLRSAPGAGTTVEFWVPDATLLEPAPAVT